MKDEFYTKRGRESRNEALSGMAAASAVLGFVLFILLTVTKHMGDSFPRLMVFIALPPLAVQVLGRLPYGKIFRFFGRSV